MMKILRPRNRGGGLKKKEVPQANLSAAGALNLNISADELIGGSRWVVKYEDDESKPPAIELSATSATDLSGYKVTRSSGSAAKVQIRSLFDECKSAHRFIGRFGVSKVAGGLRLYKVQGYGGTK